MSSGKLSTKRFSRKFSENFLALKNTRETNGAGHGPVGGPSMAHPGPMDAVPYSLTPPIPLQAGDRSTGGALTIVYVQWSVQRLIVPPPNGRPRSPAALRTFVCVSERGGGRGGESRLGFFCSTFQSVGK